MSALSPLIANTPKITPPTFYTVPYTSSDATFQSGIAAGAESPDNIVANYEALYKIATEYREFGQRTIGRASETGDGSLSYKTPCQTIVLYLSLQKNHQALEAELEKITVPQELIEKTAQLMEQVIKQTQRDAVQSN